MTLSALGIFSAAGAGVVSAGSYELIETNILSSNQSSITFSGLATYASTYKHLQIRCLTRTTHGTGYDFVLLRLNADTGSNYSVHALVGQYAGAVVSVAGTNTTYTSTLITTGATNSSNYFGSAVIDILDSFSTTKNKTTRALSGIADGDINREMRLTSGLWRNTSAISSITIYGDTGNLITGSRFSLYGIKG
jgi:hypothetical protein